jgi:tRNA threonylcarbamoyladenosine biosynthesis protein TsaE
MEALGVAIADALGDRASLLALSGELGTGKTTLARGLLRRLGVEGAIRSPTYTLIEPYDLHGRVVYHLDLYRVSDPEELDYMGVRDLLAERALVLVEWPERGGRSMPAPDLALAFSHAPPGRVVTLSGATSAGAAVLDRVRLPPACAVLP